MSLTSPKIEYSNSFVGQSSDISQTIWTPVAAGLYRVSLYAEINSLGGTVTLGFTNDSGAQTIVAEASPDGFEQDKQMLAVFRAAAGQPITLTTAIGGFPFNLYIVLEKLN
jgi:hypothetical protein